MTFSLNPYDLAGLAIYAFQGLSALWGAFCVVMAWRRVSQKRFRTERAQDEFLQVVEQTLQSGDLQAASEVCAEDRRALPQLVAMSLDHHKMAFAKLQQLLVDHFQRDVLTDLEHRISWVNTVIKSAPMLGLLGTVLGMMGAFGKLSASDNVKAEALAQDIQLALITTAVGLAIAIPLVVAIASLNVQIRKMEDAVMYGLARYLESYRAVLASGKARPPRGPAPV